MADKTFKSRIVHKHDTETNWNKATNFIPKQGEVIVYDKDSNYSYERFKIGDGSTKVNALPFADAHKANSSHTHTKSQITDFPTSLPANGGNADTVDGKHASDFATATGLSDLKSLVGDTSVSSQISSAISGKANTSDLTSHTGNTTVHVTSTERTNWNAAKTHADSAHAPSNAEANQNAFSNVTVGSTTVAADSKTDTLTLAGSNVTLTPDATNDKITIGITKTNVTDALGYTPPTTNTTYGAAGTSLGLVKSGGDVTISSGTITVNDDSHNHVISNVDGLQDALDAKGSASDVSNLKTLVGDTSVSSQISSAIANKADKTHTHNYAGSSSAGGSANSATKLATARKISLGTGATGTATSFDGSGDITIPVTAVKESYLSWGGKNFSGSYGPIDAAIIPNLGANRLAFMPATGVEVQYSTDSGSTWSTYSTTDANKIDLFNGNGRAHYIGASTATGIDKSNYQLRVIITTNTASVYTELNKFVIYCSTNGSSGSWCTIDGKTKENVDSGTDTWVTFADKVGISGWSGYNIINTPSITTYGNTSKQYQKLRFTFGVTSHSSSNAYSGLMISKIMGFGGVGWNTPSTMAATGRMYTYDASQNVTFPAKVTAPSFSGKLIGNADTATTATSATKATQDGSGNNIVNTYATKTALNSVSSLIGDKAVSTQISEAIASKSDTGHTHDDRYYTETEINNKLSGKSDTSHTHSSYVNQNAFSNVKVGSSTVTADSATDTLTLTAGNNITLTADTENDSITIAAKDTVYTHPTTSGNKHIPSGGSSGQILRWSADGTAAWGADNDTTYSNATTSAAGLMSSSDKTKLDGIATGATKVTVDSALSSTSTNPVQNKVVNSAISNVKTLVGDTSVSTQISNAISSKADLVDGKVPSSQLPSYVDDVLDYNGKSNFPSTGETGKIYVDTATNLTYRWSGSAYVEISPSLALGETSSTAYRGDRGKVAYDHSQTAHAPSNAEVNQNAFSNVKVGTTTVAADSKTDTLELVAGSNVTLTPDATNDKVTIAAKDTTYSAATTSAAGLMSASDKSKLDGIATGANKTTVDSALSATSTNPVQNKVVNTAITDLKTLVGDTSVSSQISSATVNKIDNIGVTTAGTGAAYTANVSSISALTAGVSFIMVPHTVSTSTTPTLNVNGLGAKTLKRRLSNMATAKQDGYNNTWLAANTPFRVTYDGTDWIVEGQTKPAVADLYGTLAIDKGGTGATTAEQARINLGIQTIDGTNISENADYAEVGEWADGNTEGEGRIGYFVAIDEETEGTTMVKATSTADVRGVTVTAPAFSGNCSDDKFDESGNLLQQYDYVAVMGIVPIIDNGTCTVNGRCMPADDGTAVPSSNNMGYQVFSRIDDTHVLIAVEPSADMLNRIKTAMDGKANISHNQASNTINAMTGYSKPSSTSAIATSDTLNSAVGKLEKSLDYKLNYTEVAATDTAPLNIAQGGTGATTASAARANLGVAGYEIITGDPSAQPLSVANGGTGASTTTDALSNLGVASYIAERTTSGNWIYEKYDDGIVKMWYRGTYDSAFDNGNYFGAYRGTVQTIQFPFTLQEVIYANAHHIPVNTGFALVSSFTDTSLNIYPYNRTNLTDVQTGLIMMVEVVGKWK